MRHPIGSIPGRPGGRTEATGPLKLQRNLSCDEANLAEPESGRMAIGQLMHLSGRILDKDGRPVRGAVLQLWQANAAGRYFHPIVQRAAPLEHDRSSRIDLVL